MNLNDDILETLEEIVKDLKAGEIDVVEADTNVTPEDLFIISIKFSQKHRKPYP